MQWQLSVNSATRACPERWLSEWEESLYGVDECKGIPIRSALGRLWGFDFLWPPARLPIADIVVGQASGILPTPAEGVIEYSFGDRDDPQPGIVVGAQGKSKEAGLPASLAATRFFSLRPMDRQHTPVTLYRPTIFRRLD